MTNPEARIVLDRMGCEFNGRSLHLCSSTTRAISADVMGARLEGVFPVRCLEAIARWMRDPEGVANA